MAGDWIKVELVTPDKPEIHTMAEALGMSPEEVLGRMVRLWIWADEQSLNGHAVRVTLSGLDAVCGRDGFAKAMRDVGWLVGDNGGLTFPNFDRHNGKTAKNRGLAQKRQVTHRSRISNALDVTIASLEKRRVKDSVSSSGSSTKPPTKNTEIPADFSISGRVRLWAAEHGFTRLEERLAHFRDYIASSGKSYTDWDAAFRNAIRGDWAKLNGPGGGNGATPAEELRPMLAMLRKHYGESIVPAKDGRTFVEPGTGRTWDLNGERVVTL